MAGRAVDRDSLSQAWGDGVLHSLSARAKALYSVGRFVAVDGGGAQFALPNAAHRDRCLERVTEVEAALSSHFETPVRLVLVVEGGSENPASSNGSEPSHEVRHLSDTESELEDENPEELEVKAPEEHQASAVDRLREVFPGASEVEE
jgi:hypothetical protein